MSSFTRTLQRRRLRKAADYTPKPQFTEVLDDGYLTLHPTKGFRRVSQRQVMGRQIVEQLKQAAMLKMLSRSPVAKTRRNDSAVYRGVGGAGPVRQRALAA